MSSLSQGVEYRAIFLADEQARREELPVYHVHGFLPRDQDEYPRAGESLIAFSEEGYHEVYKNSYHWSNIVQLNALRETACLFVGLSMTDPNLRRLLEIAAVRDRARHFTLMRRTTHADVLRVAKEKALPEPDEASAASLVRTHHALLERFFRELD